MYDDADDTDDLIGEKDDAFDDTPSASVPSSFDWMTAAMAVFSIAGKTGVPMTLFVASFVALFVALFIPPLRRAAAPKGAAAPMRAAAPTCAAALGEGKLSLTSGTTDAIVSAPTMAAPPPPPSITLSTLSLSCRGGARKWMGKANATALMGRKDKIVVVA